MSDADEINRWLMTEGRLLGDGQAIVEGYCQRLVAAGVPLSRANIAQRYSNPLLAAWGVVWTPKEVAPYTVERAVLDTGSFQGGPFDVVRATGKPLRKRLVGLNVETDHASYLEFAETGGTDFFAMPVVYGDGSINGSTFMTNHRDGFSDDQLTLIEATCHGLGCAMEPISLRRSLQSLLQTYLGDGPSKAVTEGTIHRGDQSRLDAVVMFSDLRGFTKKSEQWSESRLLEALNGYFDLVVKAVRDNGGDVLKFMGDGILSIFPIDDQADKAQQCANALNASRAVMVALGQLNVERIANGQESLSLGVGLNRGVVTYGNIGSPDRLDFTVLGPAVNVASRVQDLCKTLNVSVLATSSVADHVEDQLIPKGPHPIRGVAEQVAVYSFEESI